MPKRVTGIDKFIHKAANILTPPLGSSLVNPFPWVSPLIQAAAISSIAAFLMGYNLAILNTSLPFITADLGWCKQPGTPPSASNSDKTFILLECAEAQTNQSFVQSGLILGAIGGSLLSGVLSSTVGRRLALIFVYFGLSIGAIFSAASLNFAQFFLSRIGTGVFCGFSTVIPAVYLTEMAPAQCRAFYGLLTPMATNFGIFIGIVIGIPFISPSSVDNTIVIYDWTFDKIWWRLVLLFPLPFCFFAIVFLTRYYPYDTPTYLRILGRTKDASTVEAFLSFPTPKKKTYELAIQPMSSSGASSFRSSKKHSPFPSRSELMEEDGDSNLDHSSYYRKEGSSTHDNTSPVTVSLVYAFKTAPAFRHRLLVGWILSILQQLTGINVFVSASNALFIDAGLPLHYVTYASAAMAFLGFCCSVISAFHLNRVSRRTMLVGGALLMSIALLPTALCGYIPGTGLEIKQMMSVLSTLSFISFFGLTYGPGLFIYLNELFPIEVKDGGLAVAFGLNWLFCFLAIFGASFITQPQAVTVFTIVSFACGLFSFFFAPETKFVGNIPETNCSHNSSASGDLELSMFSSET